MSQIRVLLFLLVTIFVLCGCRKNMPEQIKPRQDAVQPAAAATTGPTTPTVESVSVEAPLYCSVDTLEEAQQLAQLYGIELVSYDAGYACFYTEEDPRAVILRGKEQGWPLLSLNRLNSLA